MNKVSDLFYKVRNAKKKLDQIKKGKFKTSGILHVPFKNNKGGSVHGTYNIKIIRNEATLVQIYATTLEPIERSCEKLGVAVETIAIDGFKLSDWIHDFKLRINRLGFEDKKERLQTWQTRLKAMLTPEMKQTLELEALKKEMEESDIEL